MPEKKQVDSSAAAVKPAPAADKGAEKLLKERLYFSPAPHIRDNDNVSKIMWSVVAALVPATLFGIYFFGLFALRVILIAIASTMFFEWAGMKFFKNHGSLGDGSAVITGILLALNLPSSSPWWMVVVGGFVAMIIAKQCYGGLGFNPFNPALVARVALLIAWPSRMTTFWGPGNVFSKVDAVSMPTPMGIWKVEMISKGTVNGAGQISLWDMFVGNIGGSIGEVSALALLIGGLFMLYRKIITWHIPAAYIGTVAIMTTAFWIYNPHKYINPLFHIFGGGLMLGAIFMATDMVTSPVTKKGMIVFGIGCGILTFVIRMFGGYPEGVSFSILIMNAFTPLIEKFTEPKPFGAVKGGKK
jgi:electron transport complex protein RnfD